jgi:hypothetical protein
LSLVVSKKFEVDKSSSLYRTAHRILFGQLAHINDTPIHFKVHHLKAFSLALSRDDIGGKKDL